MKILSAKVQNFASYKELEFDFDDQGLCLIAGPTGSGKSTLCDIIPWVLFGITAKNGGVDEIRSWNNDESTIGTIILELENKKIGVVRTRKPNDLYIDIVDKTTNSITFQSRGKDLNDTQKQINNLLGIDADTYLSGAYFHEFSQTAQFFSTSAKNRRSICEQIVDLSLATNLQSKTKDEKKALKNDVQKLEQNIKTLELTLSHIADSMDTAERNFKDFDNNKNKKLEQLNKNHKQFEQNKKDNILEISKKIESLEYSANVTAGVAKSINYLLKEDVCKECGTHLDHESRQSLLELTIEFKNKTANIKRLKEELQRVTNQTNPYDKQIEIEQRSENNHYGVLTKLGVKFEKTQEELELAQKEYDNAKTKLSDIELLSEIVDTFRASQIVNTISFIEDKTNAYLSEYFDAEIKVLFDVKDADKLNVEIYKDGNKCVYTQLSKGQRQLLKLCFGISVMKAVQNAKGVSFNSIFLDESLDGLSDDLKIKSYRLFTSLALDYSSVFFVEHSAEIKAIAENTFKVSINNGESTIEKA